MVDISILSMVYKKLITGGTSPCRRVDKSDADFKPPTLHLPVIHWKIIVKPSGKMGKPKENHRIMGKS